MKTIVLARLVEDFRVVRQRRTDMGEAPELEKIMVPRAMVWLNKGTDADLEKAKEFADADGYVVFTFPISERDPLGAAKRLIAEAAR